MAVPSVYNNELRVDLIPVRGYEYTFNGVRVQMDWATACALDEWLYHNHDPQLAGLKELLTEAVD